MTTLQLNTNIPANRHLTLDLALPDTVQPGEAEIVVIINAKKALNKSQKLYNQQLREKLLKYSVWSKEDVAGFEKFRKETNKWQPDEF